MRLISASFASVLVVFGLLSIGCADDATPKADADSSTDDATAASALHDGTPDTIGILALLNDKATTATTLDVSVALDKRAAANLIAKRDGADGKPGTKDDHPFQVGADVTSVAYVGASAISKLTAYAEAHNYVPTGTQKLGTYDSVTFTANDATATLNVANTATAAVLKGAGVTTAAANSIIAGRTYLTVLDLSKVANVGQTTLQKLKAFATTPAVLPPASQVATDLAAAVPGLDFMSESDYPLDVVNVAGQGTTPITADNIKDRIASIYVQRTDDTTLADREVEVVTIDSTFGRFLSPEDPTDMTAVAAVPQWQKTYDILTKEITDVQVFRLGYRYRDGTYVANELTGSIDLYIVGRSSDGALVGVHTVSVETLRFDPKGPNLKRLNCLSLWLTCTADCTKGVIWTCTVASRFALATPGRGDGPGAVTTTRRSGAHLRYGSPPWD